MGAIDNGVYFKENIEEILKRDQDDIIKWTAVQLYKHIKDHQTLGVRVVRKAVVVSAGATPVIVFFMWLSRFFARLAG